jgi:hypothetical protein
LARGDLSEMPFAKRLIAQTADDRRIEVFRIGRFGKPENGVVRSMFKARAAVLYNSRATMNGAKIRRLWGDLSPRRG